MTVLQMLVAVKMMHPAASRMYLDSCLHLFLKYKYPSEICLCTYAYAPAFSSSTYDKFKLDMLDAAFEPTQKLNKTFQNSVARSQGSFTRKAYSWTQLQHTWQGLVREQSLFQ